MEQYPKVVPSAIFTFNATPRSAAIMTASKGAIGATRAPGARSWQVHLVAGLHAKGVIPHVDMRERAVDAPLSEGMGIALRAAANLLLGDVGSPYARVGDKEALLRG